MAESAEPLTQPSRDLELRLLTSDEQEFKVEWEVVSLRTSPALC
jgi:hypothetical protein